MKVVAAGRWSPPPSLRRRQRAQAVAAAAAAAQPLVVSGRNFAPTPTLRCELHAPAMEEPHWRYNLPYGATGEDHRDDAARSAPPLATTRATFISATRVRCALPPRPSGTVLAVHVSLGEEGGPPVGPSVAHAVWFDPLARPAVTSVHLVHVSTTCPDGWTVDDTGVLTICTPATTGRARLLSEAEAEEDPTPVTVESLAAPFASTTDVSLIEVGGSNYAPTNTAGEEVALRCLFTPVDWLQAEEAYWFALGIHPANCPGTPWRCTEPPGHAVLRPGPTEPSLRVPLAPAPLADVPALHPGVTTTATFVAPSRVRCESPGGFSPEGDDTVDLDPPFLGEARLRVAAAAGGPLWSDDSRFVTVFDASMAAELTSVDPTFGDRLAPIVLLAAATSRRRPASRASSRAVAARALSPPPPFSPPVSSARHPSPTPPPPPTPPLRRLGWWARVWRCASRTLARSRASAPLTITYVDRGAPAEVRAVARSTARSTARAT